MPGRLLALLLLLAPLAAAAGEAPTIARALAQGTAPATRAKALLEVAISGPPAERSRAALLAGLYAADSGSSAAALRAFGMAEPEGGLATLAARRLTEVLGRNGTEQLWQAAATAAWVPERERAAIQVAGAEFQLGVGGRSAALRLVPPPESLEGELQARALAVRARASSGVAAAAARRELALDHPQRFAAVLGGESLAAITARFSPADWARHASALLQAGQTQAAVTAGRKGGSAGALVAARGSLRLRRAADALALARRADGPAALTLIAEAHRLEAWQSRHGERRPAFEKMLAAARHAAAEAEEGETAARARILAAEALAELGSLAQAAPLLAHPSVRSQPRWEWLVHRFHLLQGLANGITVPLGDALLTASTRNRRIAEVWRLRAEAAPDRTTRLQALLETGFPDLPSHWAGEMLGRRPRLELDETPYKPPSPPEWAHDLLEVGRVSDLLVAWRDELERGARPAAEWVGFVALAEMRTIDAVPLLIRGEPRLLSGPWAGLPRGLLERYLPLPYRSETEKAAAAAGVPPYVLAGIVRQESAWNPAARSGAGAVGLAQVLPATAREMIRRARLPQAWSSRLLDPAVNLSLGARLLASWQRSFGGELLPAIGAYNGGERRVREVWERGGRTQGPEFVEAIEMPETWDYVHRVVLLSEGYRALYWPDEEAYPWKSSPSPPAGTDN